MSAPRPSRRERSEIDRFGIFDEEQYVLKRRRGPQNDVEGVLFGGKVVLGFAVAVLVIVAVLVLILLKAVQP